MKIATCVYIVKGSYVQMANQQKKVIGFKGYSGVVEIGQTIFKNAVEEIWQETGGKAGLRINKDQDDDAGIYIREEWLEPMGMIDFYNGSNQEVPFEEPSFRVYFSFAVNLEEKLLIL